MANLCLQLDPGIPASPWAGQRKGRARLRACAVAYRTERDLNHGQLVRVSDLIVAQLPGSSVHVAIVKEIERLEAETGSAAVVIELAKSALRSSDDVTSITFRNAGFTQRAISLFRQRRRA